MRKTLFLILIALALGAYVYFYEIEGGKTREKEKERAEKLFHIDKDSISTVQIIDGSEVFKFQKSTDGWQIIQPVRTDADKSPINSLLSTVENLKKNRTLHINANELNTYGLGSGARKLKVFTENGIADSISIGDDTEIGSNVYVSKVDTLVHLVTASLKRNSGKNLFEWRNKKAINLDKDKVREIKLKNKHGSFHFIKEGGDWKISKPIETKADNSKVSAVLSKLDLGSVKKVVAEEADRLSRYGLQNPETRIDLFVGPEKAKQGLSISRLSDNEAYGKDDARSHIFIIDSTFLKPLREDLFAFRNKNVVDFENVGVDRMNLLFEDTLMTFVKDTSDNWQLSSGEKAKNWKVNSVVRKVKNLKAKRFVEEDPRYLMPYGLTNPRGRVEIFSGDDKLAEMDIGKAKGESVYARNPRVGAVVEIEESDLEEIFPSKKELIE